MIAYVCAAIIMINMSDEPWNDRDERSMKSAEITCHKKYDDCLQKFIKKEPLTYNAICGGKKDE